MKVLKTIDLKITTREEIWTQVYVSAIEAGFTVSLAIEQTDRVVDLIFSELDPGLEAELRAKNQATRLLPRPISNRPPKL